jgi:hypothetical protein
MLVYVPRDTDRASKFGPCLFVHEGRVAAFTVLATELGVSSHYSVAAWLENVEQSIRDAGLHKLRTIVLRVLHQQYTQDAGFVAVVGFCRARNDL